MSMRDKRNRAKNFTEAEEIVLVELYEENKTILDITKNNAETWQLKKQIWEDMVDTYYNRTGVRREWTGLRDKYLNMKKKARQENQQDWAYTVRKNIGKVFVKTRSSTSDSAHQYDSDISNEQNGISCEPSQDMYESSVDAHELKRFSAHKKQKREIAVSQWPSLSPRTQRSLDEEKIKLVRIQQEFYRGENKRAQEKHDHEMAKEKFRLDQEAQEGKLKIELMELEIMEKRARLDLNFKMSEGESKFGFKDMEKALETLKLLEDHDLQYRKLTVRGLLGRAKRVLTMTKAAEKLKNINEAIGVFEKWLEENGGGASNKNAKTDGDDKVETVPGLGFKDKAAALETLRVLEERDPDYQKLAIKGLIGSSKRVLSGTKNEDKIKAIKEGVKILEDFLEKFETENRIKDNRAYLPHAVVSKLPEPKHELAAEFLAAYDGPKAKGNYKHLRTMFPKSESKSWDIVRNRQIAKLLDQIKSEDAKLFNEDTGAPSALHLQLLHWAYSPQPEKVKSYVEKLAKKTPEKRKLESDSSSDDDKSSSSSDSEAESVPKKKKKVE